MSKTEGNSHHSYTIQNYKLLGDTIIQSQADPVTTEYYRGRLDTECIQHQSKSKPTKFINFHIRYISNWWKKLKNTSIKRRYYLKLCYKSQYVYNARRYLKYEKMSEQKERNKIQFNLEKMKMIDDKYLSVWNLCYFSHSAFFSSYSL